MAVKPIPDGYQAVIPYLVVQGAEALIEFMTRAFGAVELLRMKMPDGSIGHCEVRIRDSVVMIGEAGEPCGSAPLWQQICAKAVAASREACSDMKRPRTLPKLMLGKKSLSDCPIRGVFRKSLG